MLTYFSDLGNCSGPAQTPTAFNLDTPTTGQPRTRKKRRRAQAHGGVHRAARAPHEPPATSRPTAQSPRVPSRVPHRRRNTLARPSPLHRTARAQSAMVHLWCQAAPRRARASISEFPPGDRVGRRVAHGPCGVLIERRARRGNATRGRMGQSQARGEVHRAARAPRGQPATSRPTAQPPRPPFACHIVAATRSRGHPRCIAPPARKVQWFTSVAVRGRLGSR